MRSALSFCCTAALVLGCTAQTGPDGAGSVALVSPSEDGVASGVVDVIIAVAARGTRDRVDLFVDDALTESWLGASSGDLQTRLDTTTLTDGAHEFRVEALWLDGSSASDVAIIAIDNSGPAIAIAEPLADRPVYFEDGPFGFVVTVADASRVATLQLRVDGILVSDIRPVQRARYVIAIDPAAYLPVGATSGTLHLSAEAHDIRGHRTFIGQMLEVAPRRQWTFPTLGRIWEAPEVLGDGAIAVVTSEGVLHVVEPTGTERCHVRASGERGTSAPTYVASANAIVWGTTRQLRVTSATTCAHLFVHPLVREFVAKPAVAADGRIVATAFDGTVVAFRADGSAQWSAALGPLVPGGAAMEVRAGLAFGPGDVAFQAVKVGTAGGALFAIHPDGTIQTAALTAAVNGDVLVTADGIYFGARDGALYCYGFDLMRRWVVPLRDGTDILTKPAFDGMAILTSDGAGRIHARDPLSGAPLWDMDALLGRSPSGLGLIGRAGLASMVTGDTVFGDALGTVHVLGPGGRLRFRAQIGTGLPGTGIIARPAVSATHAYVGSENQTLTAFAVR